MTKAEFGFPLTLKKIIYNEWTLCMIIEKERDTLIHLGLHLTLSRWKGKLDTSAKLGTN
jgi:hypothetical protein